MIENSAFTNLDNNNNSEHFTMFNSQISNTLYGLRPEQVRHSRSTFINSFISNQDPNTTSGFIIKKCSAYFLYFTSATFFIIFMYLSSL